MSTANKLQAILNSKAAIKAAIEKKGVTDVGDVLSTYADKIASIETGGGSTGFTGHADVEGLKAIGWTDDDIAYYQAHGVNWNEEDDEYHKVPEDNIALYGVLTADNISTHKNIIVYCPKIDTSGRTSLANSFKGCYPLVAVPMLDTSSVTNMESMFSFCCSLTSVPMLDTSQVTNMNRMFYNCCSLTSVPMLDTSSVTNMSSMFYFCYSLTSVPLFDTSQVTNMSSMFYFCYSLRYVNIQNLKSTLDINETWLLTKSSLLYIINNEAATSAIAIAIHLYCYNKYKNDAEVTAALANHPNVSLASS